MHVCFVCMCFWYRPVTEAEAPRYKELIKTPMDLSTIHQKLRELQYPSVEEFKVGVCMCMCMCTDLIVYNSFVYFSTTLT